MSARPGLDEAADAVTYCDELLGSWCAMCDPDGETLRCEDLRRCIRWSFSCLPLPTVGDYLVCRDAYDAELPRRGCDAPPPEDIPECAPFVSCDGALRL